MMTVKDLIKYLQKLPQDMPLVTGNSYSCQAALVNPVKLKDDLKKYFPVYSNMKWYSTNESIDKDVLMIEDSRHYDY